MQLSVKLTDIKYRQWFLDCFASWYCLLHAGGSIAVFKKECLFIGERRNVKLSVAKEDRM